MKTNLFLMTLKLEYRLLSTSLYKIRSVSNKSSIIQFNLTLLIKTSSFENNDHLIFKKVGIGGLDIYVNNFRGSALESHAPPLIRDDLNEGQTNCLHPSTPSNGLEDIEFHATLQKFVHDSGIIIDMNQVTKNSILNLYVRSAIDKKIGKDQFL